MLTTDLTAQSKKMSWEQFRRQFCPVEYTKMVKTWDKCKDAFTGEDAIREKDVKYLYKPKSKRKAEQAWTSYRDRAKFPSYCKDTLLKMGGILSSSYPEIELPDELEFFRELATSDHGGIIALKNRVQENILKFGRYHLLLEVGNVAAGQNLFFISHIAPEKFLDCDWISPDGGETYLKWVLLDASDEVFDMRTKKRDFDRKLLVLGLDASGNYYKAKIKPEDWESFDIENPSGEVEYPAPFNVVSNRIPFFVFNVTDRSFGHYQIPPMIDLVNISLHLYNADAPYQQTLFMTADPTLVRKGVDKGQAEPQLGSDVFNDIPRDGDMKFLEFSGSGATAQLANIQIMQADAEKMGVSIAGIEGAANASGVALEIVRNAQTAALRVINENICKGIENLLRFAYKWRYPSADDEQTADAVKFTAVNDFADAKANIQEVVQLAMNRKAMELTREEMRRLVEKHLDIEHKDFDELQAELDTEIEAVETNNFDGFNLTQ